MRGLITLFRGIGSGFMMIKGFIPPGIAIIFLITDFIKEASTKGITNAFMDFAQNLLVAEKTIGEKVNLAISGSPQYGFMDLFAIISSVIILFYVIKIIAKVLFIGFTGSQAQYSAYVIASVVVAIIEFSVNWALTQSADFIPIRDGLWLLIMNIHPVIYNVDWLWLRELGIRQAVEAQNNITIKDMIQTNSSFINNSINSTI